MRQFSLCWCGSQNVWGASDENRITVLRTSEMGVLWRCFRSQRGNFGSESTEYHARIEDAVMREKVLQILTMVLAACPLIGWAQVPKNGVYISDEDIKAVLKHAVDTKRTSPDNTII